MTTQEVLDAIERERARLVGLIDELGVDAERRAVTGEGWTAKDVLAHCIHWVGLVGFALGAPLRRPAWVEAAGSERPSEAEWNGRVVAHYRPMPLEVVRRDFDQTVDATVERLRRRDGIDVNARASVVFPWVKSAVPAWKAIAGETFEHWPEHSEALERALARSA